MYLELYLQTISSRKIELLNDSPWDLVKSLSQFVFSFCLLVVHVVAAAALLDASGGGTDRMLDQSSYNHERPCAILVMDDVLVMRAPSAVDDGLDMCIQASTYHDPKVSQNTTRN